MKQHIKELILVTAICLLLYYIYCSIVDDEFFKEFFSAPDDFCKKFVTDAMVCLLLSFLSTIYGWMVVRLTIRYETLQKLFFLPMLVVFSFDMFTAWGLSELCQSFFKEQNIVVYFEDIFVFAILATMVSSTKVTSIIWQKKNEIEREQSILKNKVAEAERVMARTRLHNLQLQVNPHFFFNNLSALYSLISTDPDSAREFVSALAKMYRYILNGMNHELVPVEEELHLVREYTKLLRIRHGQNMQIILPDESQIPHNVLVPPVSIQHLIENAVKHNAMTATSPLIIRISLDGGRVTVVNNRSPLAGEFPHSGTGLANLREQLKLFGAEDIERKETTKSFSISFPLIKLD